MLRKKFVKAYKVSYLNIIKKTFPDSDLGYMSLDRLQMAAHKIYTKMYKNEENISWLYDTYLHVRNACKTNNIHNLDSLCKRMRTVRKYHVQKANKCQP